jgi:hypothetical protein
MARLCDLSNRHDGEASPCMNEATAIVRSMDIAVCASHATSVLLAGETLEPITPESDR